MTGRYGAPVEINEYGQRVGDLVQGWTPRPAPHRVHLTGTEIEVTDLEDEHLPGLLAAIGGPGREPLWTYLSGEPCSSVEEIGRHVESVRALAHPVAILGRATSEVLGMAAYYNINPSAGSIEVGSIAFGEKLSRTRAATEAMHLMARHAFDDLGYRRYEWKCNHVNEPSRAAARRLGFAYEGTFANHLIVKGRNRDTAWFSITDDEWPAIRAEHERWLAAGNFDADGGQRTRLATTPGER